MPSNLRITEKTSEREEDVNDSYEVILKNNTTQCRQPAPYMPIADVYCNNSPKHLENIQLPILPLKIIHFNMLMI